MEEYEPHIVAGTIVYAGVDYEAILAEAEKEADVVLWDGGNNDTSFFKSDLHIVVADPHRAGHEVGYYPGETNVRLADVVIINKVVEAQFENIEEVRANMRRINPGCAIIEAASPLTVSDPSLIAGKRVLVVEDGPTLTHGGMSYGAGVVAASATARPSSSIRAPTSPARSPRPSPPIPRSARCCRPWVTARSRCATSSGRSTRWSATPSSSARRST